MLLIEVLEELISEIMGDEWSGMQLQPPRERAEPLRKVASTRVLRSIIILIEKD